MRASLFILILILPSVIFADNSEGLQEIDYWTEFVTMFLGLLLVIALIIATTWFLKKYTRSKLRFSNQANGIKVLERRVLNPKASLYLIDVLGKGIVIGESQQGIHLITEFPEGTNIEKLMNEFLPEEKPSLSFSDILNKLKSKVQVGNPKK